MRYSSKFSNAMMSIIFTFDICDMSQKTKPANVSAHLKDYDSPLVLRKIRDTIINRVGASYKFWFLFFSTELSNQLHLGFTKFLIFLRIDFPDI